MDKPDTVMVLPLERSELAMHPMVRVNRAATLMAVSTADNSLSILATPAGLQLLGAGKPAAAPAAPARPEPVAAAAPAPAPAPAVAAVGNQVNCRQCARSKMADAARSCVSAVCLCCPSVTHWLSQCLRSDMCRHAPSRRRVLWLSQGLRRWSQG